MADPLLERVIDLSLRLAQLRKNVEVLSDQHDSVHARLTTAKEAVEVAESELRSLLLRPGNLAEFDSGPGSRPGSLLFRVRELLEGASVPLGPKEIASALDADPNQVYAALSRLQAEAKIVKVGPGTYRGVSFLQHRHASQGGGGKTQ